MLKTFLILAVLGGGFSSALLTLLAAAMDPTDWPGWIERVGISGFTIIMVFAGLGFGLYHGMKLARRLVDAHIDYLLDSKKSNRTTSRASRRSAMAAKQTAAAMDEIKVLLRGQNMALEKQTLAFEGVRNEIQHSGAATVSTILAFNEKAVDKILASRQPGGS